MDYMNDTPELIRRFLTYLSSIQGKSKKTVTEYAYDLQLFFRFLYLKKKHIEKNKWTDQEYLQQLPIETIILDDLNQVDLPFLYEYMAFLSEERGLSPRSRARKTSSLRSYYQFLTTKANLISNNPALLLEQPKIKKTLPRYLMLDESIQLLQAVDGPFRERDYAILTLFLNCGMRVSELVSIDLPDIQNDRMTITGKGNKERTIYLNDACLQAISDYLTVRPVDGVKDKNALFLSKRKQRINVKTVQWLVKKYIGKSGLSEERYSVHKLRHTAATLMYQYGHVDLRSLQEILGHEQLSTTQIYTHLSEERLKEASASNPLNAIQTGNQTKKEEEPLA